MRENMGLYRGKRKDNGEWAEGNLFENDNSNYPMVLIGHVVMSRDKHTNELSFDGFGLHEVDPETVGQYTGKDDSNGQKVFADDIVKVFTGIGCHHPFVGVIRYRGCGFHFEFGQYGKVLFGEWAREFYVIGNIHDNPELLEVK